MQLLAHVLRIEAHEAARTLGVCSCGAWRREVTLETLAVTGLPREEALRAAHEQHAAEQVGEQLLA
ncbi:MAG TPA: hypothetical protein VFH78_11640 [Candidatus Thermoplasmatota archaeon]|nr:hypothetical protein [Candidatus Thermoplasmatota archaeon]